jgi:hypothetical protein
MKRAGGTFKEAGSSAVRRGKLVCCKREERGGRGKLNWRYKTSECNVHIFPVQVGYETQRRPLEIQSTVTCRE